MSNVVWKNTRYINSVNKYKNIILFGKMSNVVWKNIRYINSVNKYKNIILFGKMSNVWKNSRYINSVNKYKNFIFMGPCILVYTDHINTNEMQFFCSLFCVKTLHVSDAVCVHHQEYYKL